MAETIHIGRKISRIREIRGIKQDYLAAEEHSGNVKQQIPAIFTSLGFVLNIF